MRNMRHYQERKIKTRKLKMNDTVHTVDLKQSIQKTVEIESLLFVHDVNSTSVENSKRWLLCYRAASTTQLAVYHSQPEVKLVATFIRRDSGLSLEILPVVDGKRFKYVIALSQEDVYRFRGHLAGEAFGF